MRSHQSSLECWQSPVGPPSIGALPLWRAQTLLFIAFSPCNPLGEKSVFPQTPYVSGPS